MSTTSNATGSAAVQGALWGTRPEGWAEQELHQRPLYEQAVRTLEIGPGKHVLDVGCGAGYGTFLLSWVAREVDAIDRDPEAIAGARASYQGPRYAVADGTDDALPAADVATCFEVLEHVDDPTALCGQLLGAAPEVLLSYPNPLAAGPHLNPHHRVDWPLGLLKRALHAAGARELQLFHQRLTGPAVRRGAPPWAAVWLVRALR